ncbi:Aste57867_1466 [Aphanomyces stellatus]|uniref:Aste57867_1466 protein n=1 Tax=Aphanomyces stellatus TaxID=120398 RepID=A0A485K558_9STRA|nr:hypothetical protein As57867_001465 [Aphanomyces stellatus]VFT78682.1 Aste57867_1466 [Aphanomyces stellatus]
MAKTADDKRHAGCLRQRKHQAAKRVEKETLEAELKLLQEALERLHATSRRRHKEHANPYALAVQVLQKHTRALRNQVDGQATLASILSMWVQSMHPPAGLNTPRTAFLKATLLAEPTARRHGYEWLSQRVYHTAVAASPFGSHVADAGFMRLHTRDDVREGLTVAGIEAHVQMTAFANMHELAQLFWTKSLEVMVGAEVVEVVDNDLVYYHHTNGAKELQMCNVQCYFQRDDRIVLTAMTILNDERYPQGQVLRTYGCHWMTFDRVADSVTLVRDSNVLYYPIDDQGHATLPLARIGHSFGLSDATDIEHREVYIERIRSLVDRMDERVYRSNLAAAVKELEARDDLKGRPGCHEKDLV